MEHVKLFFIEFTHFWSLIWSFQKWDFSAKYIFFYFSEKLAISGFRSIIEAKMIVKPKIFMKKFSFLKVGIGSVFRKISNLIIFLKNKAQLANNASLWLDSIDFHWSILIFIDFCHFCHFSLNLATADGPTDKLTDPSMGKQTQTFIEMRGTI